MPYPSRTPRVRRRHHLEPLFRACDLARRRKGKGRDALRTHTWLLPALAPVKRLEDLLRRDGELINAHPKRVIDGVRQRWNHRQERPLPGLLGAIGPFRIEALDQDGVDLRHL